jgi:hypothetical protein
MCAVVASSFMFDLCCVFSYSINSCSRIICWSITFPLTKKWLVGFLIRIVLVWTMLAKLHLTVHHLHEESWNLQINPMPTHTIERVILCHKLTFHDLFFFLFNPRHYIIFSSKNNIQKTHTCTFSRFFVIFLNILKYIFHNGSIYSCEMKCRVSTFRHLMS